MFRKIAAVLASVLALALTAGCATNGGSTTPTVPTQAQITTFAAAAQTKIAAACTAFQPTLTSVSALLATDATLAAVSSGVGLACAANSTLNTTSVSSLINTTIPTAIADVNASSMGNKNAVVAGLMLLQSAMSVALAEYNLSVATGTAVSLTSAVSPKVSVKLVTQ
jgi:hypothetical protein